MNYHKGDRVRHPTKEEWGVGEVLADSNGDSVKIFFVGAGEKVLALKHVALVKVLDAEAVHPVLDNLRISRSSTGIKYQSLPQSIQFFLELFPGGFYGEKFHEHERDYKEHAHELGHELLGQRGFADLINGNAYGEITKRALRLVNLTNLIFPNEKMALKDGLKRSGADCDFSEALYQLLFGKEQLESRFSAFIDVLEELDAAKWTTATYFLFLMHPAEHMFIKPTITQHAAELCGFEINYRPQLNWLTYKSVLAFSKYLFSAISDLEPRDMIDVQSFMWCIAPGTYQGA
ncbi:MAG TPA: DUF3553 domain-containing protein [Gammaproteobacteria bacterium]|nr:DUF3553 domain-containing protein [Gammaproteobacteria bacterium]